MFFHLRGTTHGIRKDPPRLLLPASHVGVEAFRAVDAVAVAVGWGGGEATPFGGRAAEAFGSAWFGALLGVVVVVVVAGEG